jgi:predicted Zn finger-like uncharacterized protein
MRFECQKCKTPYSISDDRVQGKVLKIRCRNCGETMEIKSTSSRESMPAAGSKPPVAAAPAAKKIWYVGLDGREEGPLSEEEITQLARQGRIGTEHFVWREGINDWKPIVDVPELAALFTRPPKPPPRRHTGSFPVLAEPPAPEAKAEKAGSTAQAGEAVLGEPKTPAGAGEEDRLELLKRVHQRRQQVRADRQADRIAEYFFQSTHLLGETHTLPPPPVEEAAPPATPELPATAEDPLAKLVGNDELPEEISKVTRALATKAGVSESHAKKRLGVTLAVIFGLVGMLSGLLALGFSRGWFARLGFGSVEKVSHDEAENIDLMARLSPEEARKFREQIADQGKKQKLSGRTSVEMPTSRFPGESPPQSSDRDKELLAFYQQDAERKREIAPRGLEVALAQPLWSSSPLPPPSVGATSLPTIEKTQVTPQEPEHLALSEELSEEQIKSVINSHYRGLKSCVERQLKRDARVVGKLMVSALVKAEGKVEKVWIATEKFRGTYIEECLQEEIGRWEFPRFKGSIQEVNFPLLLSAQMGE